MNHFTNQSNGSYRGHSLMGRAMLRRFALFFPMILLMLLLLPARMVAQTEASSSKYIATYDSDTETLTFEKYEGESLPSDSESEWVEDGKSVFEMFGSSYLRDIKHIVINESFKTFTPTTLSCFFAALSELETITGLEYLNTANVTDMSSLFDHCQKLTSLDLSNFNTAKVKNMELMFSHCSNLKTIYASNKFITAAVTKSKNMFSYCGSLSGEIDWTSDKATDKTYAKTGGGYFRDKAYDNRPWVKYADGTLTFRCGYKRTLGENEYELNSGKKRPRWYTHNSKISKVVFEASFANARPTTCYAWFQLFSNLKQIEGIENLNTENVTNMANMFNYCSNLAELDVTHFNTANVTDMSSMFGFCSGLTSLDVTNFNTANVTNMEYMFMHCYKLKGIYVSDKFVTDAVTSSNKMFYESSSLSGDIDWSDKAVDKTYAKIDGGYFRDKAYDNRPWVKYADGTLTFRCGYKKTLGENVYELNSGKEKPAWYTLRYDINLVVFEASFANARPKSCYAWFQNFENLKQIEGIENLNTENVTSMAEMFSTCKQLAELDVTHFNTANVTDMSYMFLGCKKLTSLDVTKFNTAKVTNMNGMFSSCSSLTSLDVTNFNTANVTVMGSMFRNCSALTSLDVTNFNTEKVTYMVHMFSGCRALTSLDVTKFNTANVANMSNMFYNCSSLTSLDVTKFNTEKVTNMSNMFYYCLKLTSLDVTKFNTEKVTDMSNMFYNCSKLTSLNVTNFNTAKVTDMRYMFYGCSSLTTIYVNDKFVIDKVTDGSYMFDNCTNLKNYGPNKKDHNYANYKTGYFTKLVGKNGDEKIGATGETLATENLVLDDNKDFVAYEPFAAKAASYSRTINAGTTWATLCLPFEVSLANQNFRAFKLLSADEGTETVELEEIETSIEAGTPVIIKMKDGETQLKFSVANKAIA
ncbi:BspA family leucine-rich repeat surface protein, partial [Segatella copri]|uniref:BspA family leucine-rich repeat surface protein n=1 Tax=Segatella copri TaxID=165179 RepID=UPI00294AC36D